MTRIIATYGINKKANDMKNNINTISSNIRDIDNAISNITNVWVGQDSKKFALKYKNEAIPRLKRYEEILNDYYTYLSRVDDVFKALDNSYNKKIE